MADDLEDNFELDEKFAGQQPDLVESTDEEEAEAFANIGPFVEAKSQKRKFESLNSKKTSSSETPNKKNKKKNITEILELKKNEINQPTYAINEFKKSLIKFINVNLSSVEKNELNLSEVSLTGEQVETLDEKLSKIILKRNKLASLPIDEQFNEKFNDKINLFLEKPDVKQSPFIVVLCSSAIRCIEVQKKLDTSNNLIKNKKVRWMHAFAKHKKLKEQVEFVQKSKNPIHLVYATPQRLAQLVEAKALKLDLLKYVVIDYTWRDVKQKRFVDMPAIKEEFFKFCFNTLLKLNKDKIQVKFYLA